MSILPAESGGAARRLRDRRVDLPGDRGEHFGQVVAERAGGGNDHNGDQGGDQAVFQSRDTAAALQSRAILLTTGRWAT